MAEETKHLSEDQLDELRRDLETRRDELVGDSVRNRADLEEQDLGEPGDPGDEGLREQDRSRLMKLEETEREELRLIEEALDRMDRDEYGRDLESGEPISIERLRAVPWARYTMERQERAERGAIDEGRLATTPSGGTANPR